MTRFIPVTSTRFQRSTSRFSNSRILEQENYSNYELKRVLDERGDRKANTVLFYDDQHFYSYNQKIHSFTCNEYSEKRVLVQTLQLQSKNITMDTNLFVVNSILNFDYMSAGIIIDTDCSSTPTNVTYGEITLSNNTFQGKRLVEMSRPMLYIYTINNITMNNNTFRAYLTDEDQISNLIQTGISTACPINDTSALYYTFTNNLIEYYEQANVSMAIYNSFTYDTTLRNLTLTIENITVRNISSFGSIFVIETNAPTVNIKNINFSNISQTADEISLFQIQSWGTVTFQNITFTDSVTSSKLLFFFQSMNSLRLQDILISNIKFKIESGSSFIKISNMNTTCNVRMANLWLHHNQMQSHTAVFSDTVFRTFSVSNSVFENEQIDSYASYIYASYAQVLRIRNTTFFNMTYSDNIKVKDSSFLIKLGQQQIYSNLSSTISSIENVTLQQSELFLFYYGGMRNYTDTYDPNFYYFQIKTVNVKNNKYYGDKAMIFIDSFISYDKIQMQIINCSFTYNTFQNGYIYKGLHNQLYPLQIINSTISNNTGGIFLMQPTNKIIPLSQSLEIYNTQIYNTSSIEQSLFVVQTNSKLFIYDSKFDSCISLKARGGLIMADYMGVSVVVNNTVFQNNFGFYGSIFFAHYDSNIQISNSQIINNAAIEGGVGLIEKGGYANITNCSIIGNAAFKSSVISITNSIDSTSSFKNCNISSNALYQLTYITTTYIPAYYQQELTRELEALNSSIQDGKQYSMKVKVGNIILDNNKITNTRRLLDVYQGNVKIRNGMISNMTMKQNGYSYFALIKTAFEVNNITFQDFYYDEKKVYHPQYFIQANLNSIVNISNTTFKNFEVQLINSQASTLSIDTTKIANFNLQYANDFLISIDQSNLVFNNSLLQNVTSIGKKLININRSNKLQIQNSNFTDFNATLFTTENSNINLINDTFNCNGERNLNNTARALHVTAFSVALISRSVFNNLQSPDSGGAILSTNANLTISRSNFTNNYAGHNGGAIGFYCQKSQNCRFQLSTDYFDANYAQDQGGAIYTNKQPPRFTGNKTTFTDTNLAVYGSNIASIPYGVRVIQYNQNQYAISGKAYSLNLLVEIIDYNGNRITNDYTSIIAITEVDSTLKISGTKQKIARKGLALFENVTLTANPGSMNVSAKVYAQSINNDYIASTFSLNASQINQEFIYFNFRRCVQGEFEFVGTCEVCELGTFSLLGNSTNCNECLDNAICYGNYQLSVNKGYWRSNFYSTTIVKCLSEDQCTGGLIPLEQTNNYNIDYPLCEAGYGGNLCDECVMHNGIQYQKIASHNCGVCAPLWQNLCVIIGVFTAVMTAIAVLIYFNLKSARNNEQTIVLRIITNYFQIMTTTGAFNLEWPEEMKRFLGVFSTIGESIESFTSIDCLLGSDQLNINQSNFYYIKTTLIAFMPIILTLFFSFIEILIGVIRKQKMKNIKNQLIVTLIVIVYTVHPTVTKYLMGLFNCMELDSSEYWLLSDLQTRCWESTHLKWSLIIGVPGITIWVIGLPVLYLLYLRQHQTELHEEKYMKKYRMIYTGFKNERYYWEFINILRKTSLVAINVFLQTYPNLFKALLCLLILSCLLQLQKRTKPYQNNVFNLLENREYMTSAVTFFGGLYFVNSKDISENIQLAAFVIIILFNVHFMALLLYCSMRIYYNKVVYKFSIYLRKLLFFSHDILKDETYRDSVNYHAAKLAQIQETGEFSEKDNFPKLAMNKTIISEKSGGILKDIFEKPSDFSQFDQAHNKRKTYKKRNKKVPKAIEISETDEKSEQSQRMPYFSKNMLKKTHNLKAKSQIQVSSNNAIPYAHGLTIQTKRLRDQAETIQSPTQLLLNIPTNSNFYKGATYKSALEKYTESRIGQTDAQSVGKGPQSIFDDILSESNEEISSKYPIRKL